MNGGFRYCSTHPTLLFVEVNEWHEQKAWEIFETYDDHKLSLVDCTSFAVMQDLSERSS